MISIGEQFPKFSVKGYMLNTSNNSGIDDIFFDINNETYSNKWIVFFFYPKDFTFVCPTEISGFNKLSKKFSDRDAQLIGGSVDNEFVHRAWCQHREELKELSFPLISDVTRSLSTNLGILNEEGVTHRATFILDPDGVIRYISVNDLNVGRNPEEILRILDALQTDELCPCNWNKGEETINLKSELQK